MKSWYVYLVRCPRGLYCGRTTDPARRFKEHCDPKKRARSVGLLGGAIEMRVISGTVDISFSARKEAQTKKLSRPEKIQLWESSNERYNLSQNPADL